MIFNICDPKWCLNYICDPNWHLNVPGTSDRLLVYSVPILVMLFNQHRAQHRHLIGPPARIVSDSESESEASPQRVSHPGKGCRLNGGGAPSEIKGLNRAQGSPGSHQHKTPASLQCTSCFRQVYYRSLTVTPLSWVTHLQKVTNTKQRCTFFQTAGSQLCFRSFSLTSG